MKKSLLLLTLVLFVMTTKAANIEYSISFTEAKGHYVDVLMNIKANKGKKVELKLPTWAPGSYLIREFSRHVEEVKATANNASLKVTKKDKNTWVVDNPNGADITVQYRVYAFELTVRTSFVDDSHAYLNGSNVFMYVEGRADEKISVKVNPLPSWKKISCALPSNSKNEFIAENYDLLADSPFEIGNQDLIEFTAQGIPHTVAMVGGGNYDAEKIKTDFTKIINEATSIFGTHPCKNYLFIVHNVPSGGGGLEHLNSTTVQVNRFAYSNEVTYRSFLGLIAHEYFHLWNVKRLRPVALGPFNYNEENYTRMLWVAEGFTAFYDNWLLRRTGLMPSDKYLEVISNEISAQQNLPGDKIQALSDASFDAWIKYYRRNENSNNSQVSYYDKGSIIASLLNVMIINNSNGTQNLDDLMKYLYNEYYAKKNIGYTDEEFKAAAEKFCGKNLDEFYSSYIDGTKPIPYREYYESLGLKFTDLNATKEELYFGANASLSNGKLIVSSVMLNSPAYKAGLNVNDEIIAIDNYRVDDVAKYLTLKKINDTINILYARDGKIKSTDLLLEKNTNVKYKLEKPSDQNEQRDKKLKKWLY